jgi:hypothetical protein
VRKKLFLLDVALAALTAFAGFEARAKWIEARKRAEVVLGQTLKPQPPPPYTPAKPPQPLTAAAYGAVAQQMLFSPDRNPTVVVEVVAPKQMPELPAIYAVIDLGEGPTAIMAKKAGDPHQEVRVGQPIGDFKLVAVDSRQVVLEWEGKTLTRRVEELLDRKRVAGPAPPPVAAAPRVSAPGAAASSAAPVPSAPGMEVGGGMRMCQPGDNSPAGTVSGGYRKVVAASPFGSSCRWEQVK